MSSSFADRSRILSYQSCPRKRYLEYELPTGAPVNGVRGARLDMNLVVGSAFHQGVQGLLENNDVDVCVLGALDGIHNDWPGYWPLVKSSGLVLGDQEDASYVYHEQAALIEALIRGYHAFVLPHLLERFTVVEVEREELAQFTSGDYTLNFMARVDALLMEKDSLDLYILSLKTAKEHGKKDEDSARHDMQGLSETAVVEQRLRKWQEILDSMPNPESEYRGDLNVGNTTVPEWFYDRWYQGALPQVMGVKMEFALKGRRGEEPYGSGIYKYSNPLIRPWKKADDLGGNSYAFRYGFKDELGGNHRLGKGWNRVNIWEDIGVKAWIEILKTQSIQGFDPGVGIAQQFILPLEYYRNQEDMARWERQVVGQEGRIQTSRDYIKLAGRTTEELLDEHFPMHTRSCDWPTKCQFQEVCFGPPQYLQDPLSSGLYVPREPNHKQEERV